MIKAFPELKGYDDPEWPIDSTLLVLFRSSGQTQQRQVNNQKKILTEKAKKAAQVANPSAGRKTPKAAAPSADDNPIDSLTQDMSSVYINSKAHVSIQCSD